VPIGVEQEQIVAADGEVDGGVNRVGDLVAELEIRGIHEGAILADEDPDRT
jgi:hypothetical protein